MPCSAQTRASGVLFCFDSKQRSWKNETGMIRPGTRDTPGPGIPRDPGYPKTRGTPGPRVPRDPGYPGTYHNNFSRRVRKGGVRDWPLVLFPTFEYIDSLSSSGAEIGPESMHFRFDHRVLQQICVGSANLGLGRPEDRAGPPGSQL